MDKNKENKNNEVNVPEVASELDHVQVERKKNLGLYIGFLFIIVAGIVTGYFLSQSKIANTAGGGKTGFIESKKTVGSTDTKVFKDSSEGTLEKGGIDGEGTHKLIRPGGDSQTLYLTSSVIDLDKYIGKKVKVWGETLAAQKAGWFMDVGRLEVMQ